MTTRAPLRLDLLLCEYVRNEQGGKMSMLGFFPAGRIRVPADTKVAIFPLSLAFVMQNVSEGEIKVYVSLKGPSGKMLLDKDPQPDAKISKLTVTHVSTVSFVPFQTEDFGVFEATIHFGDTDLRSSFLIEKREPTK